MNGNADRTRNRKKSGVWGWLRGAALALLGCCCAGMPAGRALVAGDETYMVIDLSGGTNAANYPVSYRAAPPAGGWTGEYKTTKLVLRRIESGTFMMGCPEEELESYGGQPQHEVTLTEPFYIGVFELTQKQWELVMGSNPAEYPGDARPVESVSYDDIRGATNNAVDWPSTGAAVHFGSFMGKIREKTGLDGFDLPTEAQWEYACRAGTTTALNSGENLTNPTNCPNLDVLGRYRNNLSDGRGGYSKVHTTVGSYLPNAWGLYDMHGNVWEWCLDWRGDYPSGAVTDPVGPASGSERKRMGRGGCFINDSDGCRSASRYVGTPDYRYNGGGFRPVCSVPAFALGETDVALSSSAVSGTVAVYCDAEWNFASDADWLTVEKADGGFRYSCGANPDAASRRIAIVTVTAGEFSRTCTFIQTATSLEKLYMVIDLSGGTNTANYPVSYLEGSPDGGWTDEYRTTKLVLRKIEPGTFLMGSPESERGRSYDGRENQHPVTLTRPFYIGVFELTQKQWELVMGSNPSYNQGKTRPVEHVSYNAIRGAGLGAGWPASAGTDAGSFIGKIRTRTGLALDLPTEAQWEYACRAGTTTALNTGNDLSGEYQCPEMDEAGRYTYNFSDGKGRYGNYHTTAGSYLPNAWGLYDMHGNVKEWCLDWYGVYSSGPATDPVGAASGYYRAVRGGGYNDYADSCRSASRYGYGTAASYFGDCGFRLCGEICPVRKLSVASECGEPSPAAGVHCLLDGDVVTVRGGSPVVSNGMRRVCTGWRGTGSVPASGTGTSVTFTLDGDSSIEWLWGGIEHRISVQTAGPGSADAVHQWVTDGDSIVVHLTKDDPAAAIQIGGDTDGVTRDGLTLTIPADRPRAVTVTFGAPDEERYLVLDLSGGPEAESYPVSRLSEPPAGGWTDEYKTTKLVLRKIEPGTFLMGSPEGETGRNNYDSRENQHPVTLTKPFYMGVFEITQKQWELVTGTPCPVSNNGNDLYPAWNLEYSDIRGATSGAGWPASAGTDEGSFIGKIRAKTGLAFDLPTEAQWEYACRAGTRTALNTGKNLSDMYECPEMDEAGRYHGNNSYDRAGYVSYAVVGSYLPNAWGLYDMHGNQEEWCLDWYAANLGAAAATNPVGADFGSYHVLRGGGYDDSGYACRSAARDEYAYSGGFRLCGENIPVLKLTVVSEYGEPNPGVGGHWFPTGGVVIARSGLPAVSNGTRRFCTSCTGRGWDTRPDSEAEDTRPDSWAFGFTLEEDSTITWQWGRIEHRVSVQTAGPGSAGIVHQWVKEGEPLIVQLTNNAPGTAIQIGGDATSEMLSGNTLTIPAVDGPKSVTVTFGGVDANRYLVVDLSGGWDATNYPVSYLADVPEGGWTDAYKTNKLVLRKIGPGTFRMGSPEGELGHRDNERRHEVTLTKPFYIGVFELTQKQWELVMGNNPSYCTGDFRPVECVSYDDIRGAQDGAKWPASSSVDADSFMGKIRTKTGLAGFDLPTDAQWEYACRAGTASALNSGENLSDSYQCPEMDEVGRYQGNGGDQYAAAGSCLPNAWGLYDMHGNVPEWCLDWYAGRLGEEAAADPLGAAIGTMRVRRGGKRHSDYQAADCRSASRYSESPREMYYIGFRPVCFEAGQPDPTQFLFSVISSYGASEPAAGDCLFAKGAYVTANAGGPDVSNGTRRICTGWTGTGSVPESGTNTSVAFTLDQESTIEWQWEYVEHRISVQTAGPGSADVVHQWVKDGDSLTVNLTRDDPSAAIQIGGDATSEMLSGQTLTIPADGPRAVTVTFGAPDENRYLVVDLSGGPNAASYPVERLAAPPEGGWTDEHKTMKLVLRKILPGTFTMGGPEGGAGEGNDYYYYGHRLGESPHSVTLTKPFYMGVFEITQKQWELIMGNNPAYGGDDSCPVVQVSYGDIRGATSGAKWPASAGTDAGSFIGRLRARTGLALDLPTEAQWEYACRAGTTNMLNSGKDLSSAGPGMNPGMGPVASDPEMDEVGRYGGNGGMYVRGPVGVGAFLPNAWGLYDMHGNVQEWCLDWCAYDLGTDAVTDPRGFAPGQDGDEGWLSRAIRGGSFNSDAWSCRSASRSQGHFYYDQPGASHDTGFRLCGEDLPVRKLSVESECGAPDPAAGEHYFPDGDAVSATVALYAGAARARTRQVCTGWTGTGGVPASGTGTNVDFTLDRDSSITWHWRTEHRLSVFLQGDGSVSVTSAWVAAGGSVTVRALPAAGSSFGGWEGDTSGCTVSGSSIIVPMDAPRFVTATFNAGGGGPGGDEGGDEGGDGFTRQSPVPVPHAWLDGYGLAPGGDYEAAAVANAANGQPVWECYVAGLDPTDPDARFLVRIDPEKTPVISWTPDLGAERVYIVEGKVNLTDPVWSEVVKYDTMDNLGSNRFFRVRVALPGET